MNKIIVVEDESIVRLDVVAMLEDAQFDVVAAVNNGEKAIEATEQYKPDLIIMDIKMPKLDGLKASKIISKRYDIPILILTAYSQNEFIQQAKQANIVGKPIAESQLLPAVEIALSQAKQQFELKQKVTASYEAIEQRKCIEKAKGLIMERQNISEDKAYQKLRKLSMNHHTGIEQIALKVIKQFG